MGILSIQSHVSYGHVGNAAAVFILQRLGFDVWPVHTVLFSNHPGYGDFGGGRVDACVVGDIVDGLDARGLFPTCQAIIGGYLGALECGEIMLDAVRRVRAASKGALFYLDPVMGDRESGVYVPEEIVAFYRDQSLTQADVIKANAYELEILSGEKITDVASAIDAARTLIRAHGTRVVVATSIPAERGSLATALVRQDNAWVVTTPVLPADQKGTGDAFMALLVANSLKTPGQSDMALGRSVSAIWSLMQKTCERGAPELLLVNEQTQIDAPGTVFEAVVHGL
ncbi:MAG: pyridoxal kinase [Rhodospirillales bacterium]|jgi:pyridoxine kinase|nr:pyridoxal kinase [Rhodospirillales bacterium]MBT4039680.1 pyridoxal kinase [Rhodospirillales bacterium]MBT4626458.1 pyridoxal kinase [Rhodospirillales bacterium]MBT5350859.1 pyridoxal kinase [Rhodospirillales bacterium]MBT5520701.1 pyridoxal kinase [Rhodospirillales bacterium]